MGESPFIKFYPSDFLAGTSGLSPAERGVYITLLCLIYEADGPIERHDARLSRRCGSPKAAFQRTLEALIDEGKIVEVDGMLSNRRAEKAIVDRQNRSQIGTHAAQQRWTAQSDKMQQNQRPDDARAMPEQCTSDASQKPEPEPDISKRDTNVSLALSAPEPASPIAEAVAIYNETAERVGWPKVQKLTPARSQALRGRLKDCGGIEGWRVAMDKAASSDFLSGRATGSTPATFDWLTKQSNFTKMMEGNYDNRTGNNSKHPSADAADRQIAFAAAARRTPGQDCF